MAPPRTSNTRRQGRHAVDDAVVDSSDSEASQMVPPCPTTRGQRRRARQEVQPDTSDSEDDYTSSNYVPPAPVRHTIPPPPVPNHLPPAPERGRYASFNSRYWLDRVVRKVQPPSKWSSHYPRPGMTYITLTEVLCWQDGLVGCDTDEGKYVVTSPNAAHIPRPSYGAVTLIRRWDGLFGAHNPVLWPQVVVNSGRLR